MKRLSKTEQINMRLTPDQLKRVRAAVKVLQERSGELVPETTLFRRLGMEGIDAILASAPSDDRRSGDDRRELARAS